MWFIYASVLTIIFGTIYTVAQQNLRLSANDPQIQIAQDTANKLNQNIKPSASISGNIDLNSSLAPFVIIYDKSSKVVAGNGYLGTEIPTVPIGVLTNSLDKPYNFVTWQPMSDVRIASVEVAANILRFKRQIAKRGRKTRNQNFAINSHRLNVINGVFTGLNYYKNQALKK